MKKLFNLIACFLLVTGMPSITAQDKETNYTLTLYTSSVQSETTFKENHPLCSSLNVSWNMFNDTYRHVSRVSIGFSGQTVEIYKPAIYNAVIKADKYICKAVKKGEIQKEEAVSMLKHILECAIALAMEYDTKAFEKEIASAKTPESIIRFFSHVELNYV